MHIYPGAGLGIGTAITGNLLGQSLPVGTAFVYTKIYGTLLTPAGTPVGKASGNTWKGSTLTAGVPLADDLSAKVITLDKLTTTTNDAGYFELYVIKGLTITLSCAGFGKTLTINTTGMDTVDVSTLFV